MEPAPEQDRPSFPTPYESLYERLVGFDARPVLIIAEEPYAGADMIPALATEPADERYRATVWTSFDAPATPFGAVYAPGLLERIEDANGIALLHNAQNLLREGGILAATYRFPNGSTRAQSGPALGVNGTREALEQAGFSLEHLAVSPHYPEGEPMSLVMGVLARKS